MSKRSMVGLVALVILAAGGIVHASPPNVVLIISDDQSWNHYAFTGHQAVDTPRIDRLAEQSLTFTRGYVPASLCRPSLASMITGLYPHQHRITGNDPAPPQDWSGGHWSGSRERWEANQPYVQRMEELPTIPRLLAERGYVSHQSGKWWENDYTTGGFTHGMTHGDPERGGRHGDAGLVIGRQGMEPIFSFVDEAVANEQPFFVWYAPFLPHRPHNPPDRLLDKYRDEDRPIEVARYYAMIEWFDETTGELLDFLDKRGLAEDTIVLFVCDNGWIQAHPKMDLPEGWSREGYAPGSKRAPNEGGIRTPIMIRWPGEVEPRLDERTLASSIDLMPTILAAVDVDAPADLPGINLLDEQARSSRDAIFGDIYRHDMAGVDRPGDTLTYRWIIEGPWKLIVPDADTRPDERVQLYHVLQDPHEGLNRAVEDPQRVREMRDRLDAWLNEH